jgi:hypothetical protein
METTPPGAELSWATSGDSERHPLGKAPITASIPLAVDEHGFFDTITVYASLNGASGTFKSSSAVPQEQRGLNEEKFQSAAHAALLPARISLDAYASHRFYVLADLSHLLEYEKNPERWSVALTSIQGEVSSVRESRGGCVAVLFVKDGAKSIAVTWPKDSMRGVVQGTALKVLGRPIGTTQGTNGFGAPVTILTFEGYAYQANWFMKDYDPVSVTEDFAPNRKRVFEQWAEGSLFLGDALVPANP